MADGTLQELADFLATGYWDAAGSFTRRWNLTDTGPGAMNGQITYSVSGNWVDSDGISSTHADLVRTAFQYLENITGIDFVETTSTGYDEVNIAFGNNYSGAYSYLDNGFWDVYPDSAIATHAVVNVSPTWYNGGANVENDYVLQTFIHEILHALGLGHQGYYNGSANYPTDADFDNDSWQNSIMSYFTTTENTTVDADFAFLQSVMAADLLALDALYGSQSYNGTTFGTGSAFLGDTVYGFNTNISSGTDKLMANLGTYSYDNAYCIVDAGGIDTLDMSGWNYDQLLNLTISSSTDTAPSVSNIGGLTGNLTLAVGTVIENAIGGSGDDLIYGNNANNFLVGNSGNDSLYGDDGNDDLYGSAGNDYLEGGAGIDYLVGAEGDDTLVGGSDADTFLLTYQCGSDVVLDFEWGLDSLYFYDADGEVFWSELTLGYNLDGFRQFLMSGGSSIALSGLVNFDPTGSVVISGTEERGETLSIVNTIADEDGLGAFSYQWQRDGADIGGANGATYILTNSDVGSAITVIVSYTDDFGTAETVSSAATALITGSNSAPTGSIVIEGTEAEGAVLSILNTLVDADGLGAFGYQWKRDGVAISGATAATYALTQTDVGKGISVTVSYTDGYGTTESVTSVATGAIANVNDSPTGAVSIIGPEQEGATLSIINTLADEDGLGALNYQWKRDGVAISGANAETYALTQDDVSKAITATVSYTDSFGTTESVTSAATGAIANVNDSPTGSVAIAGTEREGSTLSILNTLADEDGLGAFSYQWKRDGAAISGATATTYALTQADVDKAITVTVSYTDGYRTTESVTSAATGAIMNVNDSPTGSVSIIGAEQEGATLSVLNTLADEDGLGTFGYQWKRDGSAIPGATASTYLLTEADLGAAITVTVSYTDGYGQSESVTSSATDPIAYPATLYRDASTALPEIDGVLNLVLTGAAAIDGYGNAQDNILSGNAADNTLSGLAGHDTIYGGDGADWVFGGVGDDVAYGGEGDDVFYADAGNDNIYGGFGADWLIFDGEADVALRMSYRGEQDTGYGVDTIRGIENAIGGSGHDHIVGTGGNNAISGNDGLDRLIGRKGDDVLVGGADNDVLIGSAGHDRIFGGKDDDLLKGNSGQDILQGDRGQDVLIGGAQADVFVFTKTADSSKKITNADLIRDFQQGLDLIDLSQIDASTVWSGENTFRFIGTDDAGTGNAGTVSYEVFDYRGRRNDMTVISIDTDDDRGAEMVIKLKGVYDLTADDFIL
ncbi:M10 family metallopeptidase C-terminal domain-containing protein [Marivivens aquimaris]|uniref:M10 family metallopeptidase C-terminal domain-containing protein n=1 Tax=Marivivens aquimaris TaxID=2774876 RepID=UPI001882CA74|nr:M10 family metallopeptidase C-terminal domain-containing protein [Marivivens aquimaris]